MELVPALRFLRLNEISEAWVDAVWDLEFTEKKAFDDLIEEDLAATDPRAFKELYQSLLAFTHNDTESTDQNVWAVLQENGISVKSLVAVLSFFVFGGKLKTANVKQRVNALQAASLYLLLLGLPGSIANKVFHEVFLDTCSDMTSHCWPQDSGKKRKKEPPRCSQAEGKRSKPHRKEDMDEEEEEEEEDAAEHFSGQDLVVIRAAVVQLVESLLRLLQMFPLKDRTQSVDNCTQIFIKLLYFEPIIGEINFAEQNISKMKSVPEMAFHGIKLLCSPKHGDQKQSLQRVFHRLLYVILMMNKTSSRKPTLLMVNQSVLAIHKQAIHFICHIVNEMKQLGASFLRILLQHICFQMVEKSEYRTHGAQAVGMLTAHMSSTSYAGFVQWLSNFSEHSKMVGRLFSVDVVMVLLEQPERRPEECDPQLVGFLSHRYLIQEVLFARRMDESATVQGHALSCLAQCLELPSMNATRAVHSLFTTAGSQTELEAQTTEGSASSHQTQKTYRTLPFRTVELSGADGSVCEGKVNLAHLLQRVKDSKTNVRKAALQALMGLLKYNVIPSTWDNLSVLSARCRDPAVSVKKKALQCVGELLSAKPGCGDVQKAWLQGVLPAVMDSESSVQEKALDALDEVLLSQIKVYSNKCFLDMSQRLAWDLLDRLCHDCHSLSRYFSQAFAVWSKQNRFSAGFVQTLVSHTDAPHAAGAWLLLSKVVTSSPTLPFGKILDAWDDMMNNWKEVNSATLCNILCVMGDIAPHLNVDTQERIIGDLMSQLKTFSLPLDVISAAVEALFQYGRSEDIKQTQTFLNQHCGTLVSLCESYLASIILNESGTQNLDEELMVKYLHTLGVASLNCPAKIGKRTVLLVESILTTNSDKLTDAQGELPASLPLSQFKANCFSTKIRAHGVLTLGKLCLQHEELVQKYLPVFARELQEGTEVPVRNNVVVLMCDLCVRYTNAVDHYIPNIAARLRDDSASIRENTLIMLTNLLQEEYVKWKGSLFFRFIAVLVDPIPAIASLCEYCLIHLLFKKNPEMFSQHFIECIFHFNSYTQHKSYNKFAQSDKEIASFSLKGPQHREKRFRIYRFLLEHFTDAQRFNIINRINVTVLACFADQELPLDADGADILSETFSVLSLKELKLQAMKSSGAADEPEEENIVMAKAVLEAAQKKVVSQVQKMAFIEKTVPLIISLKHLLEQKRSAVLKDLMTYLQVTMHDYRNEVKEFFAGDEQLAAEVEFALKEAEQRKEMEERMERCSVQAAPENTPTAQSVGPCSPDRPKPPVASSFRTPQPPRANPAFTRLTLTDRRQNNLSRLETQHQSNYLEKTGVVDTRAISTPKDVHVNLTFDEGVSAILGDRSSSDMGEGSILHIRSGEQRAPGIRQWNVQSPLRKRT